MPNIDVNNKSRNIDASREFSQTRSFVRVGNLAPVLGQWKPVGSGKSQIRSMTLLGPEGDLPYRLKIVGRDGRTHLARIIMIAAGIAKLAWEGRRATDTTIRATPDAKSLQIKLGGKIVEFKAAK